MVELGPPRMASTVRRFAVPVVRRRYPTVPAQNAEGLPVYPAPEASNIMAHVYPSAGETAKLPEGGEAAAEVTVRSPANDLRAANEQTGELADEIVWMGATYEIVDVDEWQGGASQTSEVWVACTARLVVGRPEAAP